MSRVAAISILGYALTRVALASAQPAYAPTTEGGATPSSVDTAAQPEVTTQLPAEADISSQSNPATAPTASAIPPSPAPEPPTTTPIEQPQQAPTLAPSVVGPTLVQLVRGPEQRRVRDSRKVTFGVGPLLLANVHWLDQPNDRSVAINGRTSSDERYPGFVGLDAALGVMLDVRYEHFIGVEVDLLWQNDRGTGTVTINDAGSLCLIPGTPLPYLTSVYDVTIGQRAWHVPVLFKLSVPSRWHTVRDGNTEREIRIGYATFAFGPEFVFPGDATLRVAPGGLDYPLRAVASNYIMYTGALGAESRLLDSTDLRLVLSLRGSYNPTIGDSAIKRGQYDVVGSNIVPIAYRSEWRYQAAVTIGLGWFF